MTLYTIGFTRKTAEEFFSLLRTAGVKRVLDIRLNNKSQLAGFAKEKDLRYFLREVCRIDYQHLPLLAPTQEILDAYKKHKGDWSVYEHEFLKLAEERRIEDSIKRDQLDQSCLLCSEASADKCHRRLVAEYLQKKLGPLTVCHL